MTVADGKLTMTHDDLVEMVVDRLQYQGYQLGSCDFFVSNLHDRLEISLEGAVTICKGESRAQRDTRLAAEKRSEGARCNADAERREKAEPAKDDRKPD